MPTKNQWRQFFRILSKPEKFVFFILLFLFFYSLCYLLTNFYFENTEIRPAQGGVFVEGVIGQPRFINPIYASVSDIDRSLTELIFSGLMKYDFNGKIIPDLAKSCTPLEEGKIWEIELKENLRWSDNTPLSIDDVVFTVETIQNSDIKSPLMPAWIGVEVEKISDSKIRFNLEKPSAIFLENLTLKIIPKHVWGNVSSQNFPLAFYNLKPIGSGPYQLENLIQDKDGKIISIDFSQNQNYYGNPPYLKKFSFRFFDNEEKLIASWQKGELTGLSLNNLTNQVNITNLYSFSLPRYFAVFFNPDQSKALAQKEVRQALNFGTDKKTLLNQVLKQKGVNVDSPILPEIYNFRPPASKYDFNLEKANLLLDEAGFLETETGFRIKTIKKEPAFQFKSTLSLNSEGKEVEELQKCLAKDKEIYPEGEITGHFGPKTKEAVIKFQEKYSQDILQPSKLEKGTGEVKQATREKLNEVCFEKSEEIIPLKFTLFTVNQPKLVELANILKEQWKALGAEVEVKTDDASDLEKEVIKPRNYQALLFGQALGMIPDPLPFWHSTQKNDPGLNLALYENKEADNLLNEARQTLDEEKRKELLEKFQEILIEDAPAIFLYNPDYLYWVSAEIKGVKPGVIADPSQRFVDIENWYVKTQRGWK